MFTLSKLTYSFNALEPHIDAKTMEIHYGKHHQAYVDKLNLAVQGTEFSKMKINNLLKGINKVPEKIKQMVINHGGGHSNHSFFWEIMSPNGGGEPKEKLAKEIISSFGSFEKFKEKFKDSALARFGSGWVWLVINKDKKLEIVNTLNQDSPIMQGLTPILGLDVWEHAYYLKYQNRRQEYVEAWWNVVNWKRAQEIFELN